MTELDFLTRRALKSELITLMEKGDWRKILQFYEERDDYREPLLLWIRPSLEILQYLEFELHSYGLSKVFPVFHFYFSITTIDFC
uniref:Uncharacterized protein n=1 Tax=Lepeophtheirus salmonis TaxID=72036 RepID=A0A0K2TUM3_LEPSM